MKSIRSAVVGVGHLGYHHARLYSDLNHVELVGVHDLDPAQCAKVASEFGVPAFDSTEALVKAGVDVVSVAVPTSAHCELTIALLEQRIHVLVEKPIASTPDEGARMVAAAAANGAILQVGHVERFNGAVIALLESIRNPRFIECHRMSPYPNRGHDVSVVHDLMIHDLDVVLALDASPVVSVDAIGVSVFSPSEDIANARIRFESGCVANLTASRVSMERMRKIRIFEEQAYVSTDYSAQEVLVYRKKPDVTLKPDGFLEAISIDPLEVKREEPLRLELEAFLHAVREGSPPVVSGADGLKALELAERLITFMREHP